MKKAGLSMLQLAMLNVAAVLSIVNYPTQAEYGYAVLFVLGLSAITFFIPCALVSAEMAAALPHDGGLYLWGKEAFNPGVGFITVSLQFFNSLPWYGTVLTFIATTIAYAFDPALANNRLFVYGVILAVIWGCTALNCRGVKLYADLGSWGVTLGTMIPTALIIVGAAIYLGRGNAPVIPFSAEALLPQLNGFEDWMLLAGMLVSLAGIDMTALHITDVSKPCRTYPRALLLSSVLIIAAATLGSLAIALVVPPEELSVASGAGEAFSIVLTKLHLNWMIVPVCLLLALGAITTVLTWLLGPVKGLLQVAKDGYLPAFWAARNDRDIPVHLLILQATIISLICLVIFFTPNIGSAFWVFMALSAQLYMTMYLFMYAAAFALRVKKPELPRPYRIPGGLWGIGTACFLGCLTSLIALLTGFIPPPAIRAEGLGHSLRYVLLLGMGSLFMMSLPLLFYLRSEHRKAKCRPAKK